MENSNILYVKADNNKIINEKCIVWVQKIDECLHVCTKTFGCAIDATHKICKSNNPNSYNNLNRNFE